MAYHISLPARINLLGNPGDANEGDFATLSAAIELRAHALVDVADRVILESNPALHNPPNERLQVEGDKIPVQVEFPLGKSLLPYDGNLDLVKGAINQLYKHSPEFRRKYTSQGVHIAVWSDVPRQSGLGGSSLYVLLTLTGLRQVYTLDPRTHNDYVLAELAQRAEALELGITCGFADRYVPLFGGLAYIDYRGKLHHQPQEEEPFATYERLDDYLPRDPLNNCPSLPLVVACTGLRHDSGDVHSQMRPRYLEEHAAWNERGGEPPTMVKLMRAAWETAWKGKIALLKGDLETFGELMNENHLLVDRMMNYCGFPDGAGWANNLFIQEARKHGALGAKLTGAGNGGSVFALVRQGEEQSLAEVWHKAALRAGLDQAWVYLPRVSMHGLECHEE